MMYGEKNLMLVYEGSHNECNYMSSMLQTVVELCLSIDLC